jgi:hypothetical protein
LVRFFGGAEAVDGDGEEVEVGRPRLALPASRAENTRVRESGEKAHSSASPNGFDGTSASRAS